MPDTSHIQLAERPSLAYHLARGYDHYVHGIIGAGKWHKQHLVDDIQANPKFSLECAEKMADLKAVLDARGDRACHVSKIQYRILRDAFAAIAKAPNESAAA